MAGCFRPPSIRPAHPTRLLPVGAEAQFRRGEQAIDDVGRAFHAVIDEFGLSSRPKNKKRRCLPLGYTRRKLDIDLVPVIEGLHRPPRWSIPADPVPEAQR